MAYYAKFYERRTDGTIQWAMNGSDCYMPVDGRSFSNSIYMARNRIRQLNERAGYERILAFTVHKGASLGVCRIAHKFPIDALGSAEKTKEYAEMVKNGTFIVEP